MRTTYKYYDLKKDKELEPDDVHIILCAQDIVHKLSRSEEILKSYIVYPFKHTKKRKNVTPIERLKTELLAIIESKYGTTIYYKALEAVNKSLKKQMAV